MNKQGSILPCGALAMALLGLAASWLPADEPAPIARWVLAPPHVTDGVVRPTVGEWAAKTEGNVRWEEKPPAMRYDGKSSRLTVVGDWAKLNLPPREITVEAWAVVDEPREWGGLVSAIQDNGDFERGWLLGFREARFCFGLTSAGKKRLTYLTAESDFEPGAWKHVVGTYDGRTLQLYVDGKLAANSPEQTGDILYPPTGRLTLGAYHDDNELYSLPGCLSEVAIYDRVLSADEIAARFAVGSKTLPPPPPSLVSQPGWPTYMHDEARSGVTLEKLALPLAEVWRWQAAHPPQPAWPPPARQDFWHAKPMLEPRIVFDRAMHVVSDGRVLLFGSSADDQVRCLDLATGALRWTYFAEGPVRLAPTIVDDRALFGADDGCVYCVKLDDGSLLWKHSGVSPARRIPGNNRMVSAFPVRTGVLVDGGQARFAAGLFPSEGTFQFLVDVATGRELNQGPIGFSPQGYLRRTATGIEVAQGNNPAPAQVERAVRRGSAPPSGKPPSDFPYALIVGGDQRFAGGDGKVAALAPSGGGGPLWTAAVNGKAYGLAIAGGRLLVSTDAGTIHCFAWAGANDKPTASLADKPVEFAHADRASAERCVQAAERILAAARLDQGYVLVLGSPTGGLAYELAKRTKLQIVCVEPNADAVASSRRALAAAGLYGRVVVHHADGLEKLRYGSSLFNLVVSESLLAGGSLPTPAKEVERVLRPGGGMVLLGHDAQVAGDPPAAPAGWTYVGETRPWLSFTRPTLANTGEWTHIYAEPGNSACSSDATVKGPLKLTWWGLPGPRDMLDRHHRTVPPLFCAGRLFIPGDNRVYGVDPYNGTVLWERELPGTRRVAAMRDAGSMVASPDRLYVAGGDSCYVLDTANGANLPPLAPPTSVDGAPRHWGYLACIGDRLFGSSTMPGASRADHSRTQINETYFDFVPLVTSDSVFARDRITGEMQWQYRAKKGALLNTTFTLGGGRLYFVESGNTKTLTEPTGRSKLAALVRDGAELVALDQATGVEQWRQPLEMNDLEHVLFLCFSEDKLVLVGTKNKAAAEGARKTVWYDIAARDATTGRRLWTATQDNRSGIGGDHGEQDHHPAIVNGTVYVEPYAYDLATGTKQADWNFQRGGHGCGTVSASSTSFFFRAGNPTMCDLATGKLSKVNTVSRPGCWINIIPAGGLLLIPEASSGCTCNFPVQSSLAYLPGG